jgi:hypothetical protein
MGEKVMEAECKIKTRLTLECKEAANMYTKLEASLVDKSGQCSEEEYAKLRVIAQTASSLSEQLHRDLNEHTRRHGC